MGRPGPLFRRVEMKAAVVFSPGGPEVLEIVERPDPEPVQGEVVIRIRAFGLNRAELFTRQGDSGAGVPFPRIIGIECVGEVVAAPETPFEKGQKVTAMMGGMGRSFDGSYAELTRVPQRSVFAIDTDLPWEVLGALPEMFQTSNGSLHTGLRMMKEEALLIRGGTSSIGLTVASLAKRGGITVAATTRNVAKADVLERAGVDHVIVDDGGSLVEATHDAFGKGADGVLELIGTKTLSDSLRCAGAGGRVCMTGILGGEWVWNEFEPLVDIPNGVFLTSYGGGSEDLKPEELQAYVDDVAAGTVPVGLDRTFTLDEIVEAHSYMEANRARGKLVVLT
jgi:NADPH:quinone reductase-like Zn-dependent oxidoreductase